VLSAARRWRVDWFLLGMLGAALLAWLAPGPGAKGGVLAPELLNDLGVALIFFLHGLQLSVAALRQGTLHWRLHLAVQLMVFGVCPLFGTIALSLMGGRLDPSLAIGLFYLCALPSTVSSSVALTAAAGGNVPAAVFNATLSSVLGVVLTPAWVGLVLGSAGASLPLGNVVLDLVTWLLLPLALGQLCRPLWGAWASRHEAAIHKVDRGTLLLLIYTSFCDSVQSGVWLGSGAAATLVTVLFSATLLGLLLVLSNTLGKRMGLAPADRIVLVFCGSKKTLASGVPMARLMFGEQPALSLILLPIMIYHPLQLAVCGWLARRFAALSGAEHRAASATKPRRITPETRAVAK
jgi:solute carrier family 10 (sodium/bile acid cotransporter), member 7